MPNRANENKSRADYGDDNFYTHLQTISSCLFFAPTSEVKLKMSLWMESSIAKKCDMHENAQCNKEVVKEIACAIIHHLT